jgi:hypothetical protein
LDDDPQSGGYSLQTLPAAREAVSFPYSVYSGTFEQS